MAIYETEEDFQRQIESMGEGALGLLVAYKERCITHAFHKGDHPHIPAGYVGRTPLDMSWTARLQLGGGKQERLDLIVSKNFDQNTQFSFHVMNDGTLYSTGTAEGREGLQDVRKVAGYVDEIYGMAFPTEE